MFAPRWQIRTKDTRTGHELCTTEMPRIPGMGYRYETCMFWANGDSDVQDRYQSQGEAEEGHERITAELMGPGLEIEQGVTEED